MSSGGGTAVVAVHKTETEMTFLSTQGATVTNTRIIVPGKTYAMAGITSVRSTVIGAKRGLPILIALAGLFLFFVQQPVWGVIFLVGGIIWAVALKDTYAVSINSASGEIQAVISKPAFRACLPQSSHKSISNSPRAFPFLGPLSP
jgi:uncharacterized protein DUF6232